jgi:ADP-heptose:LPS heptosyltransferase
MTTPVVRALVGMFQEVHISFATNTRYLDGALVKVLKHNPDINMILERNLIAEEDYDVVINLHCPAFNQEKQGMNPANRIDIFAAHAGVHLADRQPKYFIQPKEVEYGEELLRGVYKDKLILVQPCASTPRRSYDHSKLKRLLTELYNEHRIRSLVLTHGGQWNKGVMWDNMPGGMELKDLDVRKIAAIMVHCDLVLCPDSSILHLAGALGVPTVALFGPTDPRVRVNHYPNAVALWEGEELEPCPCWYRSDGCPINQACWSLLTPERIKAACSRHLDSSKRVNIQDLLSLNRKMSVRTEVL